MPPSSKRFYRHVAIGHEAAGFRVLLSGRPVRTPAGSLLLLPTAPLAAAIVNEWLAQGETLQPETMPLTRLAATSIDRIPAQRAAVIDALVAYAESDLLCYRADAPDELVLLQQAIWQPLVDWVARQWGARMTVSAGILPVAQPREAIDALRLVVETASARQLAALGTLVQASGSLIIGLAVLHGRIDAEAACAIALLDERWQAERWGTDAEAESRRAEVAADIQAAANFLSLAGDNVHSTAFAPEGAA